MARIELEIIAHARMHAAVLPAREPDEAVAAPTLPRLEDNIAGRRGRLFLICDRLRKRPSR